MRRDGKEGGKATRSYRQTALAVGSRAVGSRRDCVISIVSVPSKYGIV